MDSPLLLSSCRFGEARVQELKAALDSEAITKDMVGGMREEWREKVAAPSVVERSALGSAELQEGVSGSTAPSWCRLLATHRVLFASCAFRVPTPDGYKYLLYSFGVQNPLLVGFIVLGEMAHIPPHCGDWERGQLKTWMLTFALSQTIVSSDKFPFPLDVGMDGLMNVLHIGQGMVASGASWMPLPEVEGLLPEVAPARSKGSTERNSKGAADALDPRWTECP